MLGVRVQSIRAAPANDGRVDQSPAVQLHIQRPLVLRSSAESDRRQWTTDDHSKRL